MKIVIAIIALALLAVGFKKNEDETLVAPDGSEIDPFSEDLFDSHWLHD